MIDELYIYTSPGHLSPLRTVMAGGMAGIMNWIVALPVDVAKSRFQTAPEGKYSSLLEVYKELIKADGIRAFYKGFTPVIIRYKLVNTNLNLNELNSFNFFVFHRAFPANAVI